MHATKIALLIAIIFFFAATADADHKERQPENQAKKNEKGAAARGDKFFSADEFCLTPRDLENVPADKLYVMRKQGLFVNLALARTPADWLKVPGVKGAWKNYGARGKTVLQDADGDGMYELYGETFSTSFRNIKGKTPFWCRLPDGTLVWETKIPKSCGDNNGVHCEDLDGDGTYEVVSVGDSIVLLDAQTGKIKLQRVIRGDFVGPAGGRSGDAHIRFDYPYRLGRCSDKNKRDIVIANGYSPTAVRPRKDGVQGYPPGGIQIICYRHDGSIAWHYKHVDKHYRGGGHEIRVRDIDGDGWDETIYSADGGGVCLNHDGSERWRHDIGHHSDWIVIADMDADGRLDVVVQQPGCSSTVGDFHIIDAGTGDIKRKIPNRPLSHVQCFAAGKFRKDLPGLQLAVTTVGGRMLRMIDCDAGNYLELAPGATDPTILRWHDLDMYNCAAHDADGDGLDEVFTFTSPKPGQANAPGLTTDTEVAITSGVAAFEGDGTPIRYWNFYMPEPDGVRWGMPGWEMRQFQCPQRRFDVDGNGVEEAFLETADWILLLELDTPERPAKCDNLFSREKIVEAMKRVHAYQAAHPWREHDRQWHKSTYYTGVMAMYETACDPKVLDQAIGWSEKHAWAEGNDPEWVPANKMTCAQTYLQIYFIKRDPAMIAKIRAFVDRQIEKAEPPHVGWYYADALYVGPPTLAMLGKAAGEQKYYDYLHNVYWDTVDRLLDKQDGLFYRDERYIPKRTAAGKKVYWSRGNGWVIAGIPRVLEYLPEDDPYRDRYVELLRTMAAAIAKVQGDDGLWRANLADAEEFPGPETSGSAFFCYAMAWGINNGVLDRREYLPVVKKAWAGLVRSVQADGRLGYVQPVSGAPGSAGRQQTHEYAMGAFLLAGSEMVKLIEQ